MWIVYALLSAIFAALTAIVAKLGLKEVDSTVATSIRTIVMGLIFVAVLILTKKDIRLVINNHTSLLFIVISAIFGALSFFFYFNSLSMGDTSKVSAIDKTSIIFVYILSVLLLSEDIKWQGIVGSILMSIGAILMVS